VIAPEFLVLADPAASYQRIHRRSTRENMMGKSTAKKLNKEPKGNGSSVDQQILATLQEILSSLRAIESHLPVDTGTMEQRLDDILRELHRHRPARD